MYISRSQNLSERDNELQKVEESERCKRRDLEEQLEQQVAVNQDLEV